LAQAILAQAHLVQAFVITSSPIVVRVRLSGIMEFPTVVSSDDTSEYKWQDTSVPNLSRAETQRRAGSMHRVTEVVGKHSSPADVSADAHSHGHHLVYKDWARITGKGANCESQSFSCMPSMQTAGSDTSLFFSWGTWVSLTLIGIGTGVVAVIVDVGLEGVFKQRMSLVDSAAEQGAAGLSGLLQQYATYSFSAMALASVAGFLVCFVSPLAAGSGIPEIKCYLNGIVLSRVVSALTLLAKAVGIIFSVSAGLPCGKEGPMIHSSAVMGGMGGTAYAKFVKHRSWDQPLLGHAEQRDFVAAGATAGVAAAFGAPMGACLFAIEEGTSHLNPRILLKLFAAAAWATLVVRSFKVISHLAIGNDVVMLGDSVPVFLGRFGTMEYSVWELPVFALIGVIGGIAGALFNYCNKQLSLLRKALMPAAKMKPNGLVDVRKSDMMRFMEVLFVTFCISSIQFWVVISFHGEAMKKEELSSTEGLFWSSGTEALKTLLHHEGSFDTGPLALFFVIMSVTTCWTYGLGVPSGLFVPSLLSGAAMGRLIGQFISIYGAASPGIYALVGAAAMLSGAARITISLAMILMEVTGQSAFSLPIFITVMVAKWTGDCFGRGIYDMHIIELNRVPLLEHDPEDEMIDMLVKEVMTTKVVSVTEEVKAGDLHKLLLGCTHNGFPVVRDGRQVGVIERDMLHFLLNYGEQYGIFEEDPRIIHHSFTSFYIVKACPPLAPFDHIEAVSDKLIDLRPYLSKSYATMQADASLYSCYNLFRGLGLRHLFIHDEGTSKVCGVVTRKDLILIEDSDTDKSDPLQRATPHATLLVGNASPSHVAKRKLGEGAFGMSGL